MTRKLSGSGIYWPGLKGNKMRFSRYAMPGLTMHRLIESDGSVSPARDETFSPRESLYEPREMPLPEFVSDELFTRMGEKQSFSSYSATSSFYPTVDAAYGGPLYDSPVSAHSTFRSSQPSASSGTPFSDTISPISAVFDLAAPPSTPCPLRAPATDYKTKSPKQQGRLRRALSTVSLRKVKDKSRSTNSHKKNKSVSHDQYNTFSSRRSSIDEVPDVPAVPYLPPVPPMPPLDMLNRRPSKLKGFVSRITGAKKDRVEKGVLSEEISSFREEEAPDAAQLDARLDDIYYERAVFADPEPSYVSACRMQW